MSASDSILVYRAESPVEAHALVARLADDGIEARVLGESLQGAYGGIRLGGMHLPEVWIAEGDRQAAEPIITAWRAEHAPANVVEHFQFPLGLLFIAMAYVAVVLSFQAMGDLAKGVVGTLLHLALLVLISFVAWKKLRGRRTVAK